MATHIKKLDEKCQSCGTNLIEVSMKNPYIDDYATECPKCDPGSALARLNASARSKAREENE